jgi:hypothetical protein
MAILFKTIWATTNRLLTIVNGFLLGLLTGAGANSILYTKKGQFRKIPIFVNLILLVALAFILFAEIRTNF